MSEVKRQPGRGRGRKPVHIGAYGTQDAIWRGVRELKTFTKDDLIIHISRDLKVCDATVDSYLTRLVRGGYVSVQKAPKHRGACKLSRYTMIRDTGVETPRLSKSGAPVTQGRGRENLWRTMKILREFDFQELAAAASTEDTSVTPATAKEYCRYLAKAGYLAMIKRGSGSIRHRYKLLPSKFTGPRPPQIQRVKQLYDPNVDKVVWPLGDQS